MSTAREKVARAINPNDPDIVIRTGIADAAIAAHLEHLAETGHAVVKLPEPTYGPDGEGQFGWKPRISSVTATPNDDGSWSVWDEDFDMTPDDARELAAALLAAAAKAEAAR